MGRPRISYYTEYLSVALPKTLPEVGYFFSGHKRDKVTIYMKFKIAEAQQYQTVCHICMLTGELYGIQESINIADPEFQQKMSKYLKTYYREYYPLEVEYINLTLTVLGPDERFDG